MLGAMDPTPRPLEPAVRRLLWLGGAVTLLAHLALNGRYGFFRDELYFIACGERLSWGYVDQPPLIALAARVAVELTGHSLWGFRLLANAAASVLVMLTGALAWRLGGGRYAVGLAMLAVGLAPDMLVRGHLLTMNAFEPVLWVGLAHVLAGMMAGGGGRAWPWVGVLVGVGLLNKYSTAFFVAALLVGLLATSQRRLLVSWRLLVAVGLAVLLVLPNVLWQAREGWPMLELLRNGQANKNAAFHAGRFFAEQLLSMGPLSIPLLVAGLGFLLAGGGAGRWRALGVAVLVGEVLFTVLKAKPYYATPLLPPLLAAGAGVAERAFASRPWPRLAAPVLLAATALPLAPLVVPVLPPDTLIAYQRALGVKPSQPERKVYRELPQHFADQFGWEELVRTVGEAWSRLPPEQRARTGLYAQNYGEAGALDFFGTPYGLPPARSGHNQYFLWGRELPEVDALLILGGTRAEYMELCGDVQEVGRVPPHSHVMPYEDNLPVFLCTHLKAPLAQVWPRARNYN